MSKDHQVSFIQVPTGFVLAAIHDSDERLPLRICILVRLQEDPVAGPHVLLRELPGSRVYLGAVCDATARIQEWIEIWVQSVDLRNVAFSGYQERLSNQVFDQRWTAEYESHLRLLPEQVVVTGMEQVNFSPIIIKRAAGQDEFLSAAVEVSNWTLCKDDALLASFGLPAYTTTSFRYLHDPKSSGTRTFLKTSADAPANAHVQGIEQLSADPDVLAVFNPQAGLIRVTRFSPLEMEDFLQILEGGAWRGPCVHGTDLFPKSIYAALQSWSATPKSLPFLLHGGGNQAEFLDEIFFLKLSALLDMFKAVRSYVKAHQLPLLNVSPSSFRVTLAEVGQAFPALWTAKAMLVKPSQAYSLKIKSTEQRYFIRLGRIEPSPFLPEGLGAHSFGVGSVRIRNVFSHKEEMELEGTLVAEDYLRLDSHDLLWFKLPLGEERLEFYAHVYTGEAVGPREVRFRTVPTRLPDATVQSLKGVAGTVFPRSPYEIWPLLSSPCDLFSLGVTGVRTLLANADVNLPVLVDEILSLARRATDGEAGGEAFSSRLAKVLEEDDDLLDLVSPHSLTTGKISPQEARTRIQMNLWMDAVALLLRLFPGAGPQSYCTSFGDVSPLALETVFDRPAQELEILVHRLRSVLVPSLSANQEIAEVLLAQLATA